MQEISIYDENNYSDIFMNAFPCPTSKKKDSFLGEEIPFGLFRNFSLKDSENGDAQKNEEGDENKNPDEEVASPGRFINGPCKK